MRIITSERFYIKLIFTVFTVVTVNAYVFVCESCGKIFFMNEKEELLVHAVRKGHRKFRIEKVVVKVAV